MTKFKMNRTQFMLLTALNMLGSGILMLPAKVAQVGGIGLLSWFVVCLAAVAMAYAFANCGIYSKYRLGGLGAIAENAFGMPGSFLTNYIYAFFCRHRQRCHCYHRCRLSAGYFRHSGRFGRCAVLNDSAALALDAGELRGR